MWKRFERSQTAGFSPDVMRREKKLIDEIGNFQDAVDLTASLAGITGKPNLLRATRQRVTLIDLLTGDVSRLNPFGAQTLKSQVRFQYLWK